MLSAALIPAISIGRSVSRLPSGRPSLFVLIRGICRFDIVLLPLNLFDAFAPVPYHPAPDVFPFVLIQSLAMFALVMRYSVRSAFLLRPSAPEVPALSQRQSEVADLLVQGLTYGEIAARLFVSTETVKSHAKAVYEKIGVPGRAALRRRLSSRPH